MYLLYNVEQTKNHKEKEGQQHRIIHDETTLMYHASLRAFSQSLHRATRSCSKLCTIQNNRQTIAQKARNINTNVTSVIMVHCNSDLYSFQIPTGVWELGVLRVGNMIPLRVLTWAVLSWAVVNNFFPSNVEGQCYTTPRVQQKPADKTTYETDIIDLREILVSVLQYSIIIQDEFWGTFGSNLTLTYPQDGSCSILGTGFPLDEVTSNMIWGNPITQIPVLVNVLKISENRIYVPSQVQ